MILSLHYLYLFVYIFSALFNQIGTHMIYNLKKPKHLSLVPIWRRGGLQGWHVKITAVISISGDWNQWWHSLLSLRTIFTPIVVGEGGGEKGLIMVRNSLFIVEPIVFGKWTVTFPMPANSWVQLPAAWNLKNN